MIPKLSTLSLLILVALRSVAQSAPAPEECIARDGSPSVTIKFGERSYRLASEACREQFLTDPERYSQLYDALQELEREGTPSKVPAATASLVPS